MGRREIPAARAARRARNAAKKQRSDPRVKLAAALYGQYLGETEAQFGVRLVDVRSVSVQAAGDLRKAIEGADGAQIATVVNEQLRAGKLVVCKPVELPHFRQHPDGRLEALPPDAPELVAFRRRLREITAKVNGR